MGRQRFGSRTYGAVQIWWSRWRCVETPSREGLTNCIFHLRGKRTELGCRIMVEYRIDCEALAANINVSFFKKVAFFVSSHGFSSTKFVESKDGSIGHHHRPHRPRPSHRTAPERDEGNVNLCDNEFERISSAGNHRAAYAGCDDAEHAARAGIGRGGVRERHFSCLLRSSSSPSFLSPSEYRRADLAGSPEGSGRHPDEE